MDWGDVPGWVEALSTLAGFAVVAYTLRQSLQDRRSEQASDIDFSLVRDSHRRLRLTIFNQSQYAVHDVCVALPPADDGGQSGQWADLGKVLPGTTSVIYADLDRKNANKTGSHSYMPEVAAIRFRDAHGQSWQRSSRGELRTVHWDAGHLLTKPALEPTHVAPNA